MSKFEIVIFAILCLILLVLFILALTGGGKIVP